MNVLFVGGIFVLIFCGLIEKSHQVSSKLDFSPESKEFTSQTGSKSPKIDSVRVTVDTTKIQRSTESRSDEKDENSSSDSNSKKKVGIRTDITFELDDDKNTTSKEKGVTKEVGRDDDDDAGVPVFKGKPTPDDRTNNENDKNYGNRRYDPNSNNRPIFHGTDDENHHNHKYDWTNFIPATAVWTTERSGWTNHPPSNNQHGHNPFINNRRHGTQPQGFVNNYKGNYPQNQHQNLWKDCNCKPIIGTAEWQPVVQQQHQNQHQPQYQNQHQPNNQHQPQSQWHAIHQQIDNRNLYDDEMYHYNSRRQYSLHPGVDDKLEEPFKIDKGR